MHQGIAAVEELLAFWRRRGADVRPPPPASALDGFEAAHGVRLPPDLRFFFEQCNGVDGVPGDDGDVRVLLEFNGIEQVQRARPRGVRARPLPGGLGRPSSFFVFADWLIGSEVFSIRLAGRMTGPHPVIRDMDHHAVKLADSFAGFVRRYLGEPGSLLASSAPGAHRAE